MHFMCFNMTLWSSGVFAKLLSVQSSTAAHEEGFLKITAEVKN
jgi:hypothetical protein